MFYNLGLWQSAAINVIRSGQMAFRSKHSSNALKGPGFCCNYHPGTHENRTEWCDARSVLNFVLRPVFVCSDHFQKMCLGIDKGFEWQARHILIISVVLKFLIICESIDAP